MFLALTGTLCTSLYHRWLWYSSYCILSTISHTHSHYPVMDSPPSLACHTHYPCLACNCTSNALSYSLSPHSLSPSLLPHSLSPPPSLSLGFRLKGRDVHSAGIATHFVAKDKVSVQLSIATTTTCSPSLVQSVSNLHLEDNDVLRVLLDSSHCVQLPALEDALDSLHHPHLDTVRGILDDFHKQVSLLCLSARVHACVCTSWSECYSSLSTSLCC